MRNVLFTRIVVYLKEDKEGRNPGIQEIRDLKIVNPFR